MNYVDTFLLVLIYFATSVVGIVTGGNSLINVPALIFFGVDPHVAVATNMFGLTFFSLSGAARFFRARQTIRIRPALLSILIVITLAASAVGAIWMVRVETAVLQRVISIFMLLVAVFMLVQKRLTARAESSVAARAIGFVLVFALGVYGGFFPAVT